MTQIMINEKYFTKSTVTRAKWAFFVRSRNPNYMILSNVKDIKRKWANFRLTFGAIFTDSAPQKCVLVPRV